LKLDRVLLRSSYDCCFLQNEFFKVFFLKSRLNPKTVVAYFYELWFTSMRLFNCLYVGAALSTLSALL